MDQDPAMRFPKWAIPVAAVAAVGVLACGGGGGESGGGSNTDTGGTDRIDIPAGTDFYSVPDGAKCDTTKDPADHVRVAKRQGGWAGISDTDTTAGLPGFGSNCRTNTDDNDGLMWVRVH